MKIDLKKYFLILLLITSCKSAIHLQGIVSNLPGEKIYLLKKGNEQTILDSTIAQNGIFQFNVRKKKGYIPELVRINVLDSSCRNCVYPIYLQTTFPNNQQDKKEWSRNYFYLEKGNTKISGDFKNNYLFLESGIENKNYFLYDVESNFWDFSWMDSTQRMIRMNEISQLILANPKSPFLINKIYQTRSFFSPNELKSLFSLFSKAIVQSSNGILLSNFINNRELSFITDGFLLNFQFLDSSKNPIWVLNDKSPITIINFWATWCGPCKAEIPVLERIFLKYHNVGVEMVSISMDKDTSIWIKELINLNLPWTQLIFPKEESEKWIQRLNVYLIPSTILLGKDHKILLQYYGFDSLTENKLDSLVKKNLVHK